MSIISWILPAIEYLLNISVLSILSAASLKTLGSFSSSLPGALSPLHGPKASQASASFSAKTVHLYVWTRKLFLSSSLDFMLGIWTSPDTDQPEIIRSEIYFAVIKKFKENNIEIPYPQRDIHIKDESKKK